MQVASASNAADVTVSSATLVSLGVDCTFVANGQSTYVFELACIAVTLTAGDFVNAQLVENPAGSNVNLGNIAQCTSSGTLKLNWLARFPRVPSEGTVVWSPRIQRAAGTGITSGVYGSTLVIQGRVWRIVG